MSYLQKRRRMVNEQIIERGIRDPAVLAVFLKVPRHLFVPLAHRGKSYADHPLPIGEGQTISQPYMVALMTEELHLRPEARVLDIGTGSGYQTAILAELCAKVYSIERIPSLAERARAVLKELGYTNVEIRVGDGSIGWPSDVPFDGIVVTASSPTVPEVLVDQLAEGGRLVIPVGSTLSQALTVVERLHGKIQTHEVCGCVFVPLIGAYGWREGQVHSEEV